jgi:hypothetical protein
MENKIHVPNHQPDIVDHCLYHVFIMSLLVGGIPTPPEKLKVKLDHHPNNWGK